MKLALLGLEILAVALLIFASGMFLALLPVQITCDEEQRIDDQEQAAWLAERLEQKRKKSSKKPQA